MYEYVHFLIGTIPEIVWDWQNVGNLIVVSTNISLVILGRLPKTTE